MSRALRTSANLSILYADLPRDDRPAAAAADGFRYVESWWPFEQPVPDTEGMEAFCGAIETAGVRLVALNLDAGDTAGGQRGLLSLPPLGERVSGNLEAVAEILTRTGCRVVNALYGNRDTGFDPAHQDQVGLDRLVEVADRLGALGAVVVVETLNLVDSPHFPLTDVAVSADVVRRANAASQHGNVRLLLDTYHLATMGTDPVDAVREHASLIGHVQFADFPGRGRPGTGHIDFTAVQEQLIAAGYDGFVGHEYDPAVMPRNQREGIA